MSDVEARFTAPYVLDACALLNLVASRRFIDIARSLSASIVVTEQVAAEVQYVRRGGDGPDRGEREAVDLKMFEDLGLLTRLTLVTPEELAQFVDFAMEMDDGEAASCALAVHGGGRLVTDDRKARRVLARQFPSVKMLTTSELIKNWADRAGPDQRDLARALIDIEERARFRPGGHDPLVKWWASSRSHS